MAASATTASASAAPASAAPVSTGRATTAPVTAGSATAGSVTASAENGGLFGASLTIADVDGDKRPDAIVAPGTLGDSRIVHYGDGACGWRAEPVDAVRPRSYLTAVAAGDVTGDGAPEIAVGYVEFSSDDPSFGVDVLTRGADGKWTRRALAREAGRSRVEAIAMGDLDGDQRADVVTVGAAGAATIFLSDARGGFTRERQTLPSPGGCQGATAVIGDLDSDGLGDIVISYAQESSSTMPDACKTEGGIAAWKTTKNAVGAARGR
jgi:FG-GAP-like repeat